MAAQTVINAINALYTSDDSSVRNQADRWLEEWQASPEAWTVANGILHDPSSGPEYTYFCAQTLKTKVQRDYEELPADAVPQLRDSLMQLLFKFGSGTPAVRTQLCLAIAALAAHLPAAQWGEGGVLRWLMNKFSGQDPAMAMSCMLELLTVLPQEADSRKIACRPERRLEFAEELRDSIPDAISLLTSCLQQPGETVRSQVLESLGCWLKLSGGSHLPPGLPESPLVAAALEGLKVDGTFHAAVDAVVELIWITVDPQTCIPNPAMTGLAQHLVGQIMALRPRFSVALRKAIAEFEGRDGGLDDDAGVDDGFDDDEEMVKGMARLFCEVAEAYIQLILAATPQVLPPVEALLDVCAHPDHEISDMSFGFWHKLSAQLTSGSSLEQQQQQQFPPPPGSPLPAGAQPVDQMAVEQQRRREFFAPCFERLVSQVRTRMRLPDGFNSMRSSERADWRRYRAAWGDVLHDAATALGCMRSLQILLQPLSEMVAPKPFDWRTAELAMHCLRCIHNLHFPHPEPHLEQLIAALPTLPSQEAQLHYTACLLLSAYAEWLGVETAAGRCLQLLPPLLNMLLSALGISGSAQAAAIAIRDVCECCGRQMQSNLQQLLTLYTKTLEAGAASRAAVAAAVAASAGAQTALNNPLMSPAQRQAVGAAAAAAGNAAAAAAGGLHEDDVQCVMQGVTTCVINCVPPEQLPAAIQTLADPLLNPIKTAMQQFTPNLGAGGETTLAPQLPLFDRLATLFDSLPAQHAPAASTLLQAWPSLDVAMLRAGQDNAALERLCRVLRYGIKASNKACASMLPTLLETLPGRFSTTGHPAFMYVVSELLKIFASEPAADTNMGHILTALLRGGCQKLRTLEEMDNTPDLMDDTFLLAGRAAAYAPRMLLHESLLPLLLDTGMLGVLVQHREACRSVLSFLSRLLDPSTALARLQEQQQQQRQLLGGTALDSSAAATALLQSQLERVGPNLSRMLMGAVVGALPYSRVADIAPVMQAMLRLGRDKTLQWLRDCMAAIPDVSLTASDRDAFMSAAAAVLAGNAGMDGGCEGIEDALELVSDLCRRNKRASKAAQAALLPVQLHQVLGLA